MTLVGSDFSGNEDEGIKVDELLGGNIRVAIATVDSERERSVSRASRSLESGTGNLEFDIQDSDVKENDNDGIALTEEAQGNLRASLC